jgi:hypothetical protein
VRLLAEKVAGTNFLCSVSPIDNAKGSKKKTTLNALKQTSGVAFYLSS